MWPAVANLKLPFVSVDLDALECTYGEVYILDKAWSRWQKAVTEMGGSQKKILSTYGRMYQDVEAALTSADERVRGELTVRRSDLALVQAEQPRNVDADTAAQKADAARVNSLAGAKL